MGLSPENTPHYSTQHCLFLLEARDPHSQWPSFKVNESQNLLCGLLIALEFGFQKGVTWPVFHHGPGLILVALQRLDGWIEVYSLALGKA